MGVGLFFECFERWGVATALVGDGREVSYQDLTSLCTEFSELLPSVKSLVLIEVDNSIECIAALYGALRAGHVVMPCEAHNDSLRQRLTETYDPDVIYSIQDQSWVLKQRTTKNKGELDADLAMLLSTSGSTGSSKCVRISYDNLQANTASISTYLPIRDSDITLLILPVFYCYGLSVLNTHLANGAAVHVNGPSVESSEFVPYLKKHQITSFSGVPYTYELLERVDFASGSFPHLRYLAQAGGRLRAELVIKFAAWLEESDAALYVMYGQTEATARMAYVPPECLLEHPSCIGKAIPGGELSLIDGSGATIADVDVPGQLVYQGPNVMQGYAESRVDLLKGKEVYSLATGDIACRNSDDLFYVIGRTNRFCKIYGKRYNLDDIEREMQRIDSTVVCVSDDRRLFIACEGVRGVDLAAMVTAEFGVASSNIATKEFSSIPVTASGKIDYQRIKEHFLSDKDARVAPFSGSVSHQLLCIYKEVFPEQNLSEKDSFATLGGDSLNYVYVSVEIEKVLGFLPRRWETLTIEKLSTLECVETTRRFTKEVETSIVLRAYCILAIVMGHAGFLSFQGGAMLLIFIAGFNFSRFHLGGLLCGNFCELGSSLVRNILIPYWGLILLASIVLGRLTTHPLDLALIGNFFSSSTGVPFYTWFVQVLVQCIALSTAPLLFVGVRDWVKAHIVAYMVLMLVVAILFRCFESELFSGAHENILGDQTLAWGLWVFVAGMLLERVQGAIGRVFITLLVCGFGVWFLAGDYSRIVTLAVGAAVLIWVSVLKLPKAVVPLVQMLGAASLFIYMTHLIGVPDLFVGYRDDLGQAAAKIVAGLGQGILVYLLYTRLVGFVWRRIAQVRGQKI